jgi:hypothetical protein
MALKPRVLVLGMFCGALTALVLADPIATGGLNVCSPALLNFLVPNNQDPLVSVRILIWPLTQLIHKITLQAVRVVDKFSVHPPTTYVLASLSTPRCPHT